VTTFEFTLAVGFIILIPFILHTISSSIAMEHIYEKIKSKTNKILLSGSTFIGALTAVALSVEESVQTLILAFALGMLLYIVSRDIIPKREKGSPALFVIGAGIVILFWLLISYILV
jgi:zinc transporter ZupT